MVSSGPDPAWERRQAAVEDLWWFDFSDGGGALAGFTALVLRPGRPAWYWAVLVGDGRPLLVVKDLEVQPPRRPASREIRAEGLWADSTCETAHEHWSVGLEAFGVAFDDADEALRSERGDRTGLGLDLEWEAAGEVAGGAGGYEQRCEVHGEVLIGGGPSTERLEITGTGWRGHEWGGRDWFGAGWRWGGHAREPARQRARLLLAEHGGEAHLQAVLAPQEGMLRWSYAAAPPTVNAAD